MPVWEVLISLSNVSFSSEYWNKSVNLYIFRVFNFCFKAMHGPGSPRAQARPGLEFFL